MVVVATACTPVRVAPGASFDREELAIYTVVIDSVLETRGDPFVVMAESTTVVGLSAEELARWMLGRDSTAFGAAFRRSRREEPQARSRARADVVWPGDPHVRPRVRRSARPRFIARRSPAELRAGEMDSRRLPPRDRSRTRARGDFRWQRLRRMVWIPADDPAYAHPPGVASPASGHRDAELKA